MIKQKVKSAVSCISDFEKEPVVFARLKHCNGIICGHIRHPANIYYDGNRNVVLYYDESYFERENEPNVEEIYIAS